MMILCPRISFPFLLYPPYPRSLQRNSEDLWRRLHHFRLYSSLRVQLDSGQLYVHRTSRTSCLSRHQWRWTVRYCVGASLIIGSCIRQERTRKQPPSWLVKDCPKCIFFFVLPSSRFKITPRNSTRNKEKFSAAYFHTFE